LHTVAVFTIHFVSKEIIYVTYHNFISPII